MYCGNTTNGEMSMTAKILWRVAVGLIYLFVVIGILSAAQTRFETLVLACLIQLYAAVLYNFSLSGSVTDINNYAAFVRFRILATGQGQIANEDGAFTDQENALRNIVNEGHKFVRINQISHGLVSIYALYKIVAALIA